MHRVIFLGPPGVGKGTQASEVSRELGVPHLSTGDLLRAAVAAKTPLGRQAEGHMAAGRLVPDDLVFEMLKERLAEPDARGGFLLDGFPRNPAQARALEQITPVDVVVSFDLPKEVLIARIVERRVCPMCKTTYNLTTQPPRTPGHCDRDGTPLIHRPDDLPEAVKTRLEVYAQQTAPLLELYRTQGLLRPIDARGTPAEVRVRVRAAIG
ncbi:MAG: adenylate kinase [Thermoplasmata archaeon]